MKLKKTHQDLFFSIFFKKQALLSLFCLSIVADSLAAEPVNQRTATDHSQGQAHILDWQFSPVDLSFLNADEKPAGKRGFVKAQGERLVFADGTVAKFWGVNIAAYTLFGTSKPDVKLQAKRLASLGFNLVRIHHMDSPWVEPNIFTKGDSTRTLSSESLDKIDWWIKCLKDEGIYVWLDLHVQRAFKKNDAITDFAEINNGQNQADLKGYNYVNASMQAAMQAFNQAYLSHKNPYTGLTYTEEPAVIAALVTNENDITSHYGNLLLPDKPAKAHGAIYMQQAKNFADKTGLSASQVWRAWEPGASKLFLNDLQHRFDDKMIDHLRGMGFKAPIVTTSYWGNSPLSALPALSAGDIIDAHAYTSDAGLDKNPLITDNLIDWLAAAHVVGKPMSVSEWNADPFPAKDRQLLPLYVATQSSFQGWDAMMLYAYAQSPAQAPQEWNQPSNWDAMYDPSLMATMPAAALVYRRADVKEAVNTYVLKPDESLFNQDINPKNSAFIRTATELGKLQIAMPENKALPWLKKSANPVNLDSANTKIESNPNLALIKSDATQVSHADFTHDWQQGRLTINTANSQGVIGAKERQELKLKDVAISSQTPDAVIMVQSLSTEPINRSKNLLISLSARSDPSAQNRYPFISTPVIGQINIKAPKGLKLYKRDDRQKEQQLPMQYANDTYMIPLNADLKTYWLNLRSADQKSALVQQK